MNTIAGKHFLGIDYMKFFAALMVVAIHTGSPYYFEVVLRVAVPFFFISSSFLFWYRSKDLKGFVKRMALLYLAWFVVEIPFVFQEFADCSIWEFLKCLLFGNTFFASWYISASIEAMALCVLLSRWLNNTALVGVGILLYVLALLGGGYFGIMPNSVQGIIERIDYIVPVTNSFITAFVYCALGKLFSDRFSCGQCLRPSILVIAMIGASALLLCEMLLLHPYCKFTDTFVTLPILSWLLLSFATIPLFWNDFSIKLGLLLRKSSTLVYFMHFIILVTIIPHIGLTIVSPFLHLIIKFLITASITVLLSFVIIHLSQKVRILKALY